MQARWLRIGLSAAAAVAVAAVVWVAVAHLGRGLRPGGEGAAPAVTGGGAAPAVAAPAAAKPAAVLPEDRAWESAPYGGRNATITLKHLDLSRPPSERELRMAGQLGGPLSPTRPAEPSAITDAAARRRQELDNLSFGRAMNLWNRHRYQEAFEAFRSHRLQFPDSAWAGESELHLGCQAQFTGRWEESAHHYDWVLNNTSSGQDMNQKARLRKAVLLMERGNLAGSSVEFTEMLKTETDWGRRTYAQYWIRQLSVLKDFQAAIRNCGNKAVAKALEMRGRKAEAAQLRGRPASGDHGYTLKELCEVAGEVGLDPVAVASDPSDAERLAAPFVAHYRDNHYVLVRRHETDGVVVVFDPRLEHDTRLAAADFGRQWSGLAVVFGGWVPEGVRAATESELEAVGGCCGAPPEEDEDCEDEGGCGSCGMPEFNINPISMNLVVEDTPLWHKSEIGPDVGFRITYKNLDALNHLRPVGNKWTLYYASYLMVNPGSDVTVVTPGGNKHVYSEDGVGGYVPPAGHADDALLRDTVNSNHFTVTLGSGTSLIYDVPAAVTNCDSSLLVAIRDINGNELTIDHNANGTITAVRDAMNREFSLGYDTNTGLLATISDTWGRVARFAYDAEGNLTNQVDMGGNSYGYTYVRKTLDQGLMGLTNDLFLASITTPKGTTSFETEPADGIQSGLNFDAYPPKGAPMWQNYRITVTHPDGAQEEYFYYGGIYDGGRQSWHRSPSQMAMVGDPLKLPRTKHYFTPVPGAWDRVNIGKTVNPDGSISQQSEIDSNRQPLQSVDEMGRTTHYSYNERGGVVRITNALGDVTSYGYATNGLDPVCMTNALGIQDWNRAYDDHRRVTSVTDAMGRTTGYGYDGSGLLVAITNNIGQVSEYIRNANHQVTEVRVGTNVLASLTYDSIGRVRTQTDTTGVTVTYDYDDLDRVTRIAWPDGTSVSNVWGCCNMERQIDRLGRVTEFGHTHDGKISWMRDPAGRVTQHLYDVDGNLERLVDPNGNFTRWEYDAMGRVSKKIYADNSALRYAYDPTGNLTNFINARGQSIRYVYDALGNLTTLLGPGAVSVTNQYDALGRLTGMVDAVGSHNFSYYDDGAAKDVDGPWANDIIHYEYDGLGRQFIRTLAGASVTNFYDTLGRMEAQDSPLGHIEYDFLGASGLPATVTRPNGLITTYTYHPASADRRLQTIHHTVGANTVSRFDYAYDRAGQITNWVVDQAAAPAPEAMAIGYDPAGQLLSARVRNAVDGTPIRDYSYAYDPAGNRTSESRSTPGTPAGVVKAMHNNLNQLTSRSGGGQTLFRGTMNEPAAVTVAGQPARFLASNRFEAAVSLPQGTNDVQVIATDAQGNSRTNLYRLSGTTAASDAYTYDLDGNMLSGVVADDGIPVSMTWDALNRLLTITKVVGGVSHLSEFFYDGQGRRVRIIEKEDGEVVAERRFQWAGLGIVEERDAANNTVKRFYPHGFTRENGQAEDSFYTRDHLSSVREIVDTSGTVCATANYEPWGTLPNENFQSESEYGFTGHIHHSVSRLEMTRYRFYSPQLGRWVSRDPAAEAAGANLYSYVSNAPATKTDFLGLVAWDTQIRWGFFDFPRSDGRIDRVYVYPFQIDACCTCKRKWFLFKEWYLKTMTVHMSIYAEILAGLGPEENAAARGFAQDHINDMTNWRDSTGKTLANQFESGQKAKKYSNQRDCEWEARKGLLDIIQPSAEAAAAASRAKWDQGDSHKYHQPKN